MNKEAILHIPLSQYAFAEDEHTLVIRLRSQKDDLVKCTLYYGDRVAQTDPMPVKKLLMEKVTTDDLFDYYEAVIKDQYTRVCYYFFVDDGKEQLYYYERNFAQELQPNRTEFFQFPYIRREDIIDMPAWAEDIIMYHIFPDSFASGKRFIKSQTQKVELFNEENSEGHLGGNLEGVIENLDYLKRLGVNCIYLNPIFTANAYHKYDTMDYFDIDPCMGTKDTLKRLVKLCHEQGIRVILDGVFNHCGSNFFAFRDVLEKGSQSKYYDWFYYMPEPIRYNDPPSYEAFAYVKEMPKLNTGHPDVIKYFCQVGTYWIKEADIDGWRLDVANEINHDFWREFRKEVRHVKKDVFLIGEIWESATCWLMGDQFDSTMNYTFSYLCKDFFANRSMSVSSFDAQIQRMIMRYPRKTSLVQMNFLDSHDVPRFLSFCEGDRRKMELAFFYLFMSMGIPSVFYGDEYYIEGKTEPTYRAAMPWEKKEHCIEKFKKWIDIRHRYDALRKGKYISVYCNDQQGCYGFMRVYQDERLLILINNSEMNVTLAIDDTVKVKLRNVLENQIVEKTIQLSAMSGSVYQVMHEVE